MEDARDAVDNAIRVLPNEEKVRVLSAQIALAELEYDRAISALQGLNSSEALAVRGRAYWYAGQIEKSADELERLLADPEVRDPWATEIAKLARLGTGRKPFTVSGGLLAVSDMPRTGTTSLIVPLELDGEPTLGMIATGTAEAVIDASAGAKPSWVSLRFGERIEVSDVPALAKDLSGISRQVNAPIKILIGVNLLRHVRPTFDFAGGQFVVRSFEPPPPPAATTVKLSYVRGGGMLLRGGFGSEQSSPSCALLVDTTLAYPVALSQGAWQKAGVSAAALQPFPGGGDLKQGVLPLLRIGAFEVPNVPGLAGDAVVEERQQGLGVKVDGLLGSGFLASFRVTLADGGRTMWIEDLPAEVLEERARAARAAQELQSSPAPAAPAPAGSPPAGPPRDGANPGPAPAGGKR